MAERKRKGRKRRRTERTGKARTRRRKRRKQKGRRRPGITKRTRGRNLADRGVSRTLGVTGAPVENQGSTTPASLMLSML